MKAEHVLYLGLCHAQIKRDLHRIGGNLVLVVFPFKNRDQQSAALRNWDLWGPMASHP